MSDVIVETSNFVKQTNGKPFSNFSRTMKLTSSEEVKYPYYLSFETEEISRRQLQDLAIQNKYLRASYKIL